MGYYDAELLIQDLNRDNAEIYKKGWVYVTSPNDKKAPLYFAPYFTGENEEPGIKCMSRVRHIRDVKLSDTEAIPDPPSDDHSQAWSKGLKYVRERALKEGFADKESRLLYMDRPIAFRKTPLTKQSFKDKGPAKRIPNQIPKGFSLRFDELLGLDP